MGIFEVHDGKIAAGVTTGPATVERQLAVTPLAPE